jgi:glutamate dehydrogenase (NAD(P)+)
VLGRAFDDVWGLHAARDIDLRLAAHTIAVTRVAEAQKLRGLYP